ncbi:unnamed protein product [Paramecium octaurelia]|uniref:Uncharacterized protein n=1 Tax=Paramecium octaurelia TaxID=43137 RepID=A0A8S1V1W2_PAROT|nr:unnamed protein product [Paramecium octaurelia]
MKPSNDFYIDQLGQYKVENAQLKLDIFQQQSNFQCQLENEQLKSKEILKDYQKQLQEHQREMQTYKSVFEKTINKLMEENNKLQTQLTHAEIEKIQMNLSQQTLSECKQCIHDLSNPNIDKESYELLQNTIKEYKLKFQDIKARNEICESKLKACQDQILKLQIQIKEKSELEDKAKEVQQKYQQQLLKLKENFDKQSKELQQYMGALNDITKKLEEEQIKNDKLKQEFEQEKKRLQEENRRN